LDKIHSEEQILISLEPNWDKTIGSTHTFNSVDNLYEGDICVKRNHFFLKH